MSEPWETAWEKHKDAAAEAAHIAWMKAKISHGFADHPWVEDLGSDGAGNWGGPLLGCGYSRGGLVCPKAKDKHHSDMIPFADLSDEIKQYDYDTAIIGFEIGFKAGTQAVFSEMDARGMFP